MFNTLKHASTRHALLAAALFATATSAFAQAPTEAQKSAIRSACRSDFIAHCSSVTPGGVEAYQCLQSHMSSLSGGCQTAVRAVEPAAAPKTEAAPAKSEPAKSEPTKSEPAKSEPAKTEGAPAAEPATKPAAEAAPKAAAAKQPSSAQVAAVKSACRTDYPKVCASVPPGGAPALECLEKNKAKVSPACEKAVSAATGGGAAATAAPADAAPAAAASAVIVLRPLLPREELFIVRSACGADIRSLCAGVAPGGGRIIQCISNRAASLSPACKDVLAPFAAR